MCTAVTCDANKFNLNGRPNDGCEVGCAAVPYGTCNECNAVVASGCTKVTCKLNRFDENGVASDGCEVAPVAPTPSPVAPTPAPVEDASAMLSSGHKSGGASLIVASLLVITVTVMIM